MLKLISDVKMKILKCIIIFIRINYVDKISLPSEVIFLLLSALFSAFEHSKMFLLEISSSPDDAIFHEYFLSLTLVTSTLST